MVYHTVVCQQNNRIHRLHKLWFSIKNGWIVQASTLAPLTKLRIMGLRSLIMAFLLTKTKDVEAVDAEIWAETLFMNQLDL